MTAKLQGTSQHTRLIDIITSLLLQSTVLYAHTFMVDTEAACYIQRFEDIDLVLYKCEHAHDDNHVLFGGQLTKIVAVQTFARIQAPDADVIVQRATG